MCDRASLNKLLSEVYRFAQESFGSALEAVILYGSYARNEAEEGSDVDIMLLVDWPAGRLASMRKMWNHFGTDLDLRYNVLTSFKLQDLETFNQWRDTLPFFRNVLREGVRISA